VSRKDLVLRSWVTDELDLLMVGVYKRVTKSYAILWERIAFESEVIYWVGHDCGH
jgi:hypothetical protein